MIVNQNSRNATKAQGKTVRHVKRYSEVGFLIKRQTNVTKQRIVDVRERVSKQKKSAKLVSVRNRKTTHKKNELALQKGCKQTIHYTFTKNIMTKNLFLVIEIFV